MAKQFRSKKVKLPSLFREIREFIFGKAVALAVTAVFLVVAFVLVKAFLYKSDYFRLRVIETRGAFMDQKTARSIEGQLLGLYKGRNLFQLALKEIAASVRTAYPDARYVVVRIVLPDKLSVDLNLRRAVALAGGAKYYPVDEYGAVVLTSDSAYLTGLPVIEGVSPRTRGPASRNLLLGLELLREAKRYRVVNGYGITKIAAGDMQNLSFFLRSGLEIRIGCENFKERLAMLEKTLRDPRLVMDKIQYIDVRFEEVVIGPK